MGRQPYGQMENLADAPSNLLMLRCAPEASLEARTTGVRPSRPRSAGTLG